MSKEEPKELRKYVVYCGEHEMPITAEVCMISNGILEFYRNGEALIVFKEWDYFVKLPTECCGKCEEECDEEEDSIEEKLEKFMKGFGYTKAKL